LLRGGDNLLLNSKSESPAARLDQLGAARVGRWATLHGSGKLPRYGLWTLGIVGEFSKSSNLPARLNQLDAVRVSRWTTLRGRGNLPRYGCWTMKITAEISKSASPAARPDQLDAASVGRRATAARSRRTASLPLLDAEFLDRLNQDAATFATVDGRLLTVAVNRSAPAVER